MKDVYKRQIFFNYADFGFITVCQKYVGEYYAKNDLREEIKIVGFTSFLLILFVVIVGFFLLPIAISPRILIDVSYTHLCDVREFFKLIIKTK